MQEYLKLCAQSNFKFSSIIVSRCFYLSLLQVILFIFKSLLKAIVIILFLKEEYQFAFTLIKINVLNISLGFNYAVIKKYKLNLITFRFNHFHLQIITFSKLNMPAEALKLVKNMFSLKYIQNDENKFDGRFFKLTVC